MPGVCYGTEVCQHTPGIYLWSVLDLVESRTARHLYATSIRGVVGFSRDRREGSLAPLPHPGGCASSEAAGCLVVGGGNGADLFVGALALPRDGRHLYVSSLELFWVFERDRKSGMLRLLEERPGSSGDLTVSRNGKWVYHTHGGSGSTRGGVSWYRRNKRTGALTLRGTIDGPIGRGFTRSTLSRDGKNLYVVSRSTSAVTVYSRDRRTGALRMLPGSAGCVAREGWWGCARGIGMSGATDVAVSKDGQNVYVASDHPGALAVFARDQATGALTQLPGPAKCFHWKGHGGCQELPEFNGVGSVAVSDDGKHVYVGAKGLVAFARDQGTGALTPLPDVAPLTVGGFSLLLSRSGRHVYTGGLYGFEGLSRARE